MMITPASPEKTGYTFSDVGKLMKSLTIVLVSILLLTGCVGVNGDSLIDELKKEASTHAPQVDLLNEQRAAYYNGAFDTCMYHNLGAFARNEDRTPTDDEIGVLMAGCDEFAWDVISTFGVLIYGDEPAGEVAPQRESVPEYKCTDCQNT